MLAVTRLNPNVWWYFARAGGLVSWALLATSVFWGLIYAGRLTRSVPPPAWNFDIHRFLGGLSVTFVIIHVAALTADKYVNFGLSQVLVPLASSWRPGAVAWGIVALYLLIAVEATSLAMRWMPRKLWRKIHLLSFALFGFSTVHAIQTGTDVANPFVRSIGLGLLVTALVVAILRVGRARRRHRAPVPTGEPTPASGLAEPSTGGPSGHVPAVDHLVAAERPSAPSSVASSSALRDAPTDEAATFPPSSRVGRSPKVPRFAEAPRPNTGLRTSVFR
ncbi:MAG: ferric reductase-like transmembrane domain-containing protein [Actinomycetota bacterium]|nr:ferric reductase-like transmembrane domain-containing protein [Actinomycetota bacterium]